MTRLFFLALVWLLPSAAVHAQELAHAGPSPIETPLLLPPLAAAPPALDAERVQAGEEQPEPRRHTALLIAGASTFMTSYLVTAIVGAALGVVEASDCEAGNIVKPCRDGILMLVPLVGPFFTSRSFDEQLGLAGPQIVGALLAVAGIFHYASHPQHVGERASLQVYPVPLPAGCMLRATLRL